MPLTTIPEIGTRVVVTGAKHQCAGMTGEVSGSSLHYSRRVWVCLHNLSDEHLITLDDLDLDLPRAA